MSGSSFVLDQADQCTGALRLEHPAFSAEQKVSFFYLQCRECGAVIDMQEDEKKGSPNEPSKKVSHFYRKRPGEMLHHKKGLWLAAVTLKFSWSGRQDLNLRHLAPKASALPDCATPRGLEMP